MCGFIVFSLTTKVARFEPTMKESKSFALPLGYTLIIKDVADWYSALPNHLRQPRPQPDYTITTHLLNSEDGMLPPSILGEARTHRSRFSP